MIETPQSFETLGKNIPNDTVSHPRMFESSMNATVWTSNLILNSDKLCTHFSSVFQPHLVHCEIKTIVIEMTFSHKFHAPLKSRLCLVCLHGWSHPHLYSLYLKNFSLHSAQNNCCSWYGDILPMNQFLIYALYAYGCAYVTEPALPLAQCQVPEQTFCGYNDVSPTTPCTVREREFVPVTASLTGWWNCRHRLITQQQWVS